MKPIWLAILVGALAALAFAPPASAVPIQIQGNAYGCFGASCTPGENSGPFTTSTGAQLFYASGVPADFGGTTDYGFLAINGTTGTFGAIGLAAASPAALDTVPFTLQLSFLSPTVSPDLLFQALIFGAVTNDPTSGGILLAFASPPQSISFTNGIPGNVSGTLAVLANNTSLPPGQTTQITGFITATTPTAVTPEPGTLGLMTFGLAGILGLAWRRRKERNLA